MNKKGFTLIELLAVLGLLTIIALLGVPVLLNQIESQKKKNYENFVGDLCLSAEAYINHSNDIEDIESFKEPGDVLSIKMEDLIVNNYVKSNTKNPKTKEKIKATDTIIVTINENKTYDCSLNNEVITVTFDANGGVLSNNTKNVVLGSSYGTLPTPTRQGYTFKGWHGKNMFNILNIESTNSNNWDVTIDNNSVFINHKNEYTNGIPEIEFDSLLEGQYYLNGDNLDYIALYINDEYIRMVKTNQIIQINNNDKIKFTFHTPTNLVTEYSNIQLEEGTTATAYEPYYIQANTKVVQDKNHTLKAIWEKN